MGEKIVLAVIVDVDDEVSAKKVRDAFLATPDDLPEGVTGYSVDIILPRQPMHKE